jgi:hypothetical protein
MQREVAETTCNMVDQILNKLGELLEYSNANTRHASEHGALLDPASPSLMAKSSIPSTRNTRTSSQVS